MKILRYLTSVLFLMVVHSAAAQHQLTSACNMWSEDSVTYRCLGYIDHGCQGENIVWDFRTLESLEHDGHPVHMYGVEESIVWEEKDKLFHYLAQNDSLLIFRREHPIYSIVYQVPVTEQTFPFSYNQKIKNDFEGTGLYDNHFFVSEKGISSVTSDAYGTLVLHDDDTIRNVLRIHSTMESELSVSYKGHADKITHMHRVADRYKWYARGYRYPILQTVDEKVTSGDTVLFNNRYSLLLSPEGQKNITDSINQIIRTNDSLFVRTNEPPFTDLTITLTSTSVDVSFVPLGDVRIVASVTNAPGIVYWRDEHTVCKDDMVRYSIPTSGLQRGQYLLNLSAEGRTLTRRLNITP